MQESLDRYAADDFKSSKAILFPFYTANIQECARELPSLNGPCDAIVVHGSGVDTEQQIHTFLDALRNSNRMQLSTVFIIRDAGESEDDAKKIWGRHQPTYLAEYAAPGYNGAPAPTSRRLVLLGNDVDACIKQVFRFTLGNVPEH